MTAPGPTVTRRSIALLIVVGGAMAFGYAMGTRSTGEVGEPAHFQDWVESIALPPEQSADREQATEQRSDVESMQADMPAVGYDQMRRGEGSNLRAWEIMRASASDLRDYANADPNLNLPPVDPMDATDYAGMRRQETGPTSQWTAELMHLPTYGYHQCITCHDPHSATVQPNQEDKLESLAIRSTRRAFNGSPPVVPHPVEHTDDAACYACHNQGVKIGNRVANRMSHGYLSNCVQCHAAPLPQALAVFEETVENDFAGLKAPVAGDRAFPSAPPVIPHSTWMRERCLSCHGGIAGWPGLEVTHRWRTNCTQCHAVSATLEQAVTANHGPLSSVSIDPLP